MKSLNLVGLYFLLLSILLIFLWQPIHKVWNELIEHVDSWKNLELVLSVMVSFACCHIINALSWMVLLKELRGDCFTNNLRSTLVYSMLINILPIGTGHVVGIWFFKKYHQCTTKQLLFGWSLDQYIRGIVKVCCLMLFIQLFKPFGQLGERLQSALDYFALLLVLGALVLWLGVRWEFMNSRLKKLSCKLGLIGESVFEKKWRSVFFKATLLRAICWVFEIVPVWILCHSLLETYSLEMVMALFLSVKMATAYSIAPGNFGVHEGVAYFVAQAYGVDTSMSLNLGFMYHLGFWLPTVLPGLMVLAMGWLKAKLNKHH